MSEWNVYMYLTTSTLAGFYSPAVAAVNTPACTSAYTDGKTFPPTYSYRRAVWALFTQLAVITGMTMVKTESVDTAVQEVTNVLITAAELSIPKSSSHSFQHYKPW
ncbi:hypothetical protein TNCV_3346921 [Trichonephila clavipes]|nr:hypothetical protein TNCV_3346921 [Trichonephila clavipes]